MPMYDLVTQAYDEKSIPFKYSSYDVYTAQAKAAIKASSPPTGDMMPESVFFKWENLIDEISFVPNDSVIRLSGANITADHKWIIAIEDVNVDFELFINYQNVRSGIVIRTNDIDDLLKTIHMFRAFTIIIYWVKSDNYKFYDYYDYAILDQHTQLSGGYRMCDWVYTNDEDMVVHAKILGLPIRHRQIGCETAKVRYRTQYMNGEPLTWTGIDKLTSTIAANAIMEFLTRRSCTTRGITI